MFLHGPGPLPLDAHDEKNTIYKDKQTFTCYR